MLRVYEYALGREGDPDFQRLLRRAEADIAATEEAVRAILEDVRLRGDAALLELTRRFDGVDLPEGRIRADEGEIAAQAERLRRERPDVGAAIETAAANIRRHHERQLPPPITWGEIVPGVFAGEKVTPLPSVALYVPRGKGSFPSVLLMLAVPARVAGVPKIAVFTPPNAEGTLDPAVAYAAELLGIREVYKVGGAQAVAAAAFGTESVPRFPKILGPGNRYVAQAKRLLYGSIDPGLPAGPSEALVLADASARPDWVARDLLVEAEHGPESAALLVTPSRELAEAVKGLLPEFVASLPEPRQSFVRNVFATYGGAVLTPDLDTAFAFADLYAPEHLLLHVADPLAAAFRLRHAGEILIGPYTTIPLGNFVVGVNAILPTGGAARWSSGVSVHDFLKRTSLAYVTSEGFRALGPHAVAFADVEGFPAHLEAVRARLEEGTREKNRG
ncbi:MAG: histidinol dehydrogenase [Brockia lithotrophica]|nr:histidinol dehydrogenase [Brockia lithotrophica]